MNIITQIHEASIKVNRSEFIASLAPIKTVEEAKEHIRQTAKKHHKARHNCWAYVIGFQGEQNHSSDDGEPSGSAGKPILGKLRQHEITNVVAVVTRFFGGVKLGVRGLIDAYGGATEEAILLHPRESFCEKFSYCLEVEYPQLENIKYHLGLCEAQIDEVEYSDKVLISVSTVADKKEKLEQFFQDWSRQIVLLKK